MPLAIRSRPRLLILSVGSLFRRFRKLARRRLRGGSSELDSVLHAPQGLRENDEIKSIDVLRDLSFLGVYGIRRYAYVEERPGHYRNFSRSQLGGHSVSGAVFNQHLSFTRRPVFDFCPTVSAGAGCASGAAGLGPGGDHPSGPHG